MYKGLNESYTSEDNRLKAEGFKEHVLQVLRAWEEWYIFSHKDFLIRLPCTFFGIPIEKK